MFGSEHDVQFPEQIGVQSVPLAWYPGEQLVQTLALEHALHPVLQATQVEPDK